MKTKKEIVKDWLPRYTGLELDQFGEFILLTNFQKYVDEFAKINNVNVDGEDKTIIMSITGKIDLKKISKLTSDLNMPGSEELKNIDQKI